MNFIKHSFIVLLLSFGVISFTAINVGNTWTHGYSQPPPAAPAQAIAQGYTKLVRNNDFSATGGGYAGIDLANTGASGFQWYISVAAPFSGLYTGCPTPGGYAGNWCDAPANLGSCIVQQSDSIHGTCSSGPSPSDPGDGRLNVIMANVAFNASTQTWVGDLLPIDSYCEFRFKWNHNVTTDTTVLAIWPVNWFIGQTPAAPYNQKYLNELDSPGSSNATQAHFHGIPHSFTGNPNPDIIGNWSFDAPVSWAIGDYHTAGFLNKSVTTGGGTGTTAWYIDNVLAHSYTYTAADGFAMGAGMSDLGFVAHWYDAGSLNVVDTNMQFVHCWTTPYLLERDLNPAANDNSPAFLAKVG